mmetsp:Transcript_72903/g.200085  ORF Transcript_72903/g.200085 Transcript_72903/m.200085 type:complete len:316 (-) Transcript_72903:554-1501(-)
MLLRAQRVHVLGHLLEDEERLGVLERDAHAPRAMGVHRALEDVAVELVRELHRNRVWQRCQRRLHHTAALRVLQQIDHVALERTRESGMHLRHACELGDQVVAKRVTREFVQMRRQLLGSARQLRVGNARQLRLQLTRALGILGEGHQMAPKRPAVVACGARHARLGIARHERRDVLGASLPTRRTLVNSRRARRDALLIESGARRLHRGSKIVHRRAKHLLWRWWRRRLHLLRLRLRLRLLLRAGHHRHHRRITEHGHGHCREALERQLLCSKRRRGCGVHLLQVLQLHLLHLQLQELHLQLQLGRIALARLLL